MAIRWKERDLVTVHVDHYRQYRESVPMLIPSAPKAAEPTITA